MRREHKIALSNANVSRKREQEAVRDGDLEGAAIQDGIARLYESDADFWAVAEDAEND